VFMGWSVKGGIVYGNVSRRRFSEGPEVVKIMSDGNREV